MDVHGPSGAKDDWRDWAICKEGIVDEAFCGLHIVEDSEWCRGFLGRDWRELNVIDIEICHRGMNVSVMTLILRMTSQHVRPPSMSLTVISHSLQPQRGFHSTLSTILALDPPDSDCSFFALYTFPQTIIIDRYELVDRRLSFEFWGESNLELPVFALDQTANSLLLINATNAHPKQVTVDIPVHARYGEPDMAQSITLSSPMCFWACPPSGTCPV